jgi:hypothetical protein
MLASIAVLAAAPPPGLPKASASSGLISTGQMTVRAVVVDHCTVSPTGATCAGGAPIRPLVQGKVPGGARAEIVF